MPATPPEAIPPDAVVAYTIRDLTRALLGAMAAVLLLGLAAVAMVTLAGSPTGLAPALVLLGVGQAGALAGGVVVLLGLRRVARPDDEPRHDDGATAARAAAALAARASTAARLRTVVRAVLVVGILAATAWALLAPETAWGALAGLLVGAQAAVVLALVGRRLAGAPDGVSRG